MPYQLFAAIGSLCLEADRHGAKRAVLIVHEFRTNLNRRQENGREREDARLLPESAMGEECEPTCRQ
jgi:hypothetical protein